MIPDPSDALDARLRYLELTPADRKLLGELAETLLPHLDEVLEAWHGYLLEHPATAALLANPSSRGHLMEAQRRYFRSLLTAGVDDAYLADRARVGRVHHGVRLAPFWYLGAARKFIALLRSKLRDLGHGADTVASWSSALEKMLTLDLAIALGAYHEAEQEALLRSNLELERQMKLARESARLREEFLEQISHELRTPLHAMLGFSDLVADGIQGPVTSAQMESLAKVRVHGEQLVGIVDRLLEAARLSASAPAEPQPFDVVPLLTEAAAGARDAAALKALRFTCDVPRQLPRVLGDPRGTSLAIRQLLDNAVRFTRRGAVELSAFWLEERLHIEVSDSGPGILPSEIDRIFERFRRVSGSDGGVRRGAGIGLALAREALQRSGGGLTLERTGTTGCTFAVLLPLAPGPTP